MAIDFGEMQPRRLPVYLLIGTPVSMQGVKIAAINNGIAAIYQELMGDPRSAQTVHISLITFADQAYQMPMVPIQQFVPPQLSVAGRGASPGCHHCRRQRAGACCDMARSARRCTSLHSSIYGMTAYGMTAFTWR